jgi:tetratricopeptide (TPR) repeat protein
LSPEEEEALYRELVLDESKPTQELDGGQTSLKPSDSPRSQGAAVARPPGAPVGTLRRRRLGSVHPPAAEKTERIELVDGVVSAEGTQKVYILPSVEELRKSARKGGWLLRPVLGSLRVWQLGAIVAFSVTISGFAVRFADEWNALFLEEKVPLSAPVSIAGLADSDEEIWEPSSSLMNGPSTCKPFSEYRMIPWHAQIAKVLGADKGGGLCSVFGRTRQELTPALAGLKPGPRTGYDLLPDGVVWEFYPDGVVDRSASHLELFFSGERLFEVRAILAKGSAIELDLSTLEPLLGKATRKGVDFRRRAMVRHDDGDLVVEIFADVSKASPESPARELVFTGLKQREEQAKPQIIRRKAEADLADGVALLEKGKLDEAIRKFRMVSKLVPSSGEALVWEARTQAYRERWAKVEPLLALVEERSRDDRAKAKALALRAVRALASGEVKEAPQALRKAEKLDPADREIAACEAGVSRQVHDPEAVALTSLRLECLWDHREEGWTEVGVLARGCFSDKEDYRRALKGLSVDELAVLKQRYRARECR